MPVSGRGTVRGAKSPVAGKREAEGSSLGLGVTHGTAFRVAGAPGLEPGTYGFGVRQLALGRILNCRIIPIRIACDALAHAVVFGAVRGAWVQRWV